MDSVKRILLFCLVLLVMNTTAILGSSVYAADGAANETQAARASKSSGNSALRNKPESVVSPATDLWRAVRQRDANISGRSQVKGPDAGTLINTSGQEWRNFRVAKLIPYGLYLVGGVLLIIALFRLIRGKIKIQAGRSTKRISRFTNFQRFVHWSVAILFVILGLTGMMITFGRTLLVPLIGNEAFGAIAGIGKILHDYLGPVFSIMLVVMLFTFIKGNFFNWVDIKWFAKGGGLAGKHASAGRYNGGEKAWFWVAILAGAVVVVSGLILDFPFFNQTRADMELANIVHAIGAIGLLAASFGHIFMGTIAMEGAFEAMKTGYCDENWAKEHHDLWYEEIKEEGKIVDASSIAGQVARETASEGRGNNQDSAGSAA